MKNTHILIVEDEIEIAEILSDYMKREGYLSTILNDGEGVVDFVKNEKISLILLDLMLPGKDGISICTEIRKFSNVPIIMITAKVDEIDRILGIELGADDYVCKPFSPREVTARVKAVLRRVDPEKRKENICSYGSVCIDKDARQVTIHGNELSLTPSEFDILEVMLSNPNKVFTRATLIEKVQGYNYDGYERTIDFHIKNLRKKIGKRLDGEKLIQSIYGVGYKLVISD